MWPHRRWNSQSRSYARISEVLGVTWDETDFNKGVPTGDRKGTWSLFVTKNWRMTFRIDRDEIEIIDLDYEDYH